MRSITDHVADPAGGQLKIDAMDEPSHGGASHWYRLETPAGWVDIHFQNGPIKENGVNGVTQEALLAIVIDRLRSFQAGSFSCRENAIALTKCEEALHWLHARTRARMARGVEGTDTK